MQVSDKWFESVTPLQVFKSQHDKTGVDYNIFISPSVLHTAVSEIYTKKYHLEDISILDVEEGFLLTYHFAFFDNFERIAIRTLIKHANAEIDSIYDIYQGAEWHERECRDFYAINFLNNPNLIPLLLDVETPAGVLCKDPKNRKSITSLIDFGESLFVLEGFSLTPDPNESEAIEETN